MSPDFSIVTPSFNYGSYIADCLQSVAAQEGVSFEHLVMDAGSSDDTAAVVGNFPHARFFQEPDRGMSDGINKGFRKATGKWVMWLNADDRLRPGALARVKAFAETRPTSDVIYGCWNFIDAEGGFLRRMTLFPFDKWMLILDACYLGSTACFYRLATTIDAGFLLDEDFQLCMDGEFYARLAIAGKRFDYLPAVLAEFRLHGQSISQGNLGKRDLHSILKHQRLLAEPRAIRRAYGATPFANDHLNMGFDCITHLAYRAKKRLLRLLHRHRVID